ncbi:MAG: tetratricopeptide repeat protein [Planctomycetia bacterium]|nr:tetratricopeptide repeat protein [Planctomycetia bacterium]
MKQLSLFLLLTLAGVVQAQDRVTFLDRSSKTGGTLLRSGSIAQEDPGKITLNSGDGRRSDIPVPDVVDVIYDGEPQAEMNSVRQSERDHRYDAALAACSDAMKKTTPDKKLLRRHLEYKMAELRSIQAEKGTPAAQAIDALRVFIKNHPDSRQSLSCLETLGRLLIASEEPVTEVLDSLAQLRSRFGADNKEVANRCDLIRSDLILQQLSALFAKAGAAGSKSQLTAASKSLQELQTISDRSIHPELAARIIFCQVLQDPSKAPEQWEALLATTDDPTSRAAIHLTRGDFYRLTRKDREAMWDYLWVDTVYFADRHQQAKALYQLMEVFDKLGDQAKARDCRERLRNDNRLKDTRYHRLAAGGKS